MVQNPHGATLFGLHLVPMHIALQAFHYTHSLKWLEKNFALKLKPLPKCPGSSLKVSGGVGGV